MTTKISVEQFIKGFITVS